MVAMPFGLIEEIVSALARLNALSAHEQLMAIMTGEGGTRVRAEDAVVQHRRLVEQICHYVERERAKL
jgi:hypothetical protein